MMLSELSLFPLLTASLWFGFILRLGSFLWSDLWQQQAYILSTQQRRGKKGGWDSLFQYFQLKSQDSVWMDQHHSCAHPLEPISEARYWDNWIGLIWTGVRISPNQLLGQGAREEWFPTGKLDTLVRRRETDSGQARENNIFRTEHLLRYLMIVEKGQEEKEGEILKLLYD